MFGLFKNKEQKVESENKKLQDLNTEVKDLNELNKKYKNCICKIKDFFFVFLEFDINKGEIVINYTKWDTPKDMQHWISLKDWRLKYGSIKIEKFRDEWLIFKDRLERLGIEIKIK